MLNGPTVSSAPDVSSAVMGVMGSGSGHEGVIGTMRDEVENPNMNPARQAGVRGMKRRTYLEFDHLYWVS